MAPVSKWFSLWIFGKTKLVISLTEELAVGANHVYLPRCFVTVINLKMNYSHTCDLSQKLKGEIDMVIDRGCISLNSSFYEATITKSIHKPQDNLNMEFRLFCFMAFQDLKANESRLRDINRVASELESEGLMNEEIPVVQVQVS